MSRRILLSPSWSVCHKPLSFVFIFSVSFVNLMTCVFCSISANLVWLSHNSHPLSLLFVALPPNFTGFFEVQGSGKIVPYSNPTEAYWWNGRRLPNGREIYGHTQTDDYLERRFYHRSLYVAPWLRGRISIDGATVFKPNSLIIYCWVIYENQPPYNSTYIHGNRCYG